MARRIMAIGTTAEILGAALGGALRGLLGTRAGWVIVASREALFLLPPVLQVFRRVPLTTPGPDEGSDAAWDGATASAIRRRLGPHQRQIWVSSLRLVTTPRGSAPRSASRLIVDARLRISRGGSITG